MELPPPIPHINKDEYTYLDDEPLHKHFDYCINSGENAHEIYICLYDIQYGCRVVDYGINGNEEKEIHMPFLKYLVIQESNYTFPHFHFECIDDSDENEQKVKNEAMIQILNMLNLKQNHEEASKILDLDKCFKGYVYEQNVVLMVYDFMEILQLFGQQSQVQHLYSKHMWAIVDELVFEKQILGKPIQSEICDLMVRNPLLWNIYYQGRELDFPFSLLYIHQKDDVWQNEKMPTSAADVAMKMQSMVKIGEADDSYKYGDEYGELHLFASKPLYDTAPEDKKHYQRYAVFTIGAKYILDPNYHGDLMQANEMLGGDAQNVENENVEEEDIYKMSISSLYFVEDKLFGPLQVWGIRELSRFMII
jgi:hypothetical protein